MKTLVFLIVFLPMTLWAQSGEFRGHVAMDKVIKERILVPNDTSLLDLFKFNTWPYDFAELLGVYDEYTISTGQIRNGTPNAFNMILWHTLMNNLSIVMSRECRPEVRGSHILQSNVAASVRELCKWPMPSAKNSYVYENLFLDITFYDVPAEEFDVWYNHFVASGNYDHLTPEKFIQTIMYSLLMNPYFLLQP